MPAQPTACAHGAQRSRGLGGGTAPLTAALAAGCLGSCPHLFSLFLSDALTGVVDWDVVPGGWSLSQHGICSSCCGQR